MNYHNCKPFFYFFFLGKGGNQLKLRCKQKIPSLHPVLCEAQISQRPHGWAGDGQNKSKREEEREEGVYLNKTQSLNELQ